MQGPDADTTVMTRGPEKRKPRHRSGRPWEPAPRAHAESPKPEKKRHGKCHGDEHDAASAAIGQTVCHETRHKSKPRRQKGYVRSCATSYCWVELGCWIPGIAKFVVCLIAAYAASCSSPWHFPWVFFLVFGTQHELAARAPKDGQSGAGVCASQDLSSWRSYRHLALEMGQKLKAIGSSYVPELVPFFQNPFHIYLFFPTGYVQNSLTGCLCGVQKIGGLNNSSNYGLSPLSSSRNFLFFSAWFEFFFHSLLLCFLLVVFQHCLVLHVKTLLFCKNWLKVTHLIPFSSAILYIIFSILFPTPDPDPHITSLG